MPENYGINGKKRGNFVLKTFTFYVDKHKENEIFNAKLYLVQLSKEVIYVAKQDFSMFNPIYKDISEKLGVDTAKEIFSMFKGQQITFPVRFFNPKVVRDLVRKEYNGKNVRHLAAKYGYSEKTIRRIIKEETEDNR